ncbi:MAG: Holliday junction branch migration protein RuvA [Micavibrio aeruginosavorus]|uniref:Holliday junction branch migration complex subunit RuvA n=1 Tax=Micavibrio aeruginosavorus TaxID=349221 RepID=A0A2W5FI42_9BACT|nr:MAG: Holliday junction branch migration protein RuvA [Micavibrio aeruginosavorus]
MFAKLTGKIDTLFQDSLILDVNGVGYHVFASGRTLGVIGNHGDAASLLIETHVREDHIHLYGFASAAERDWFKILTAVQGVGARSGLAILTACPPDKLIIAIAANDTAILRQAEGVGPKLATRIVSELKSKVENMNIGVVPVADFAPKKKGEIEKSAVPNVDQDAVSALVNLGYGRTEAFSAVMYVRQKSNDNSLNEIIKLALKELSS